MTAKTIYTKLSGLRARTEPLPKPPASPLVLWAEAGIHLLLGAVLAEKSKAASAPKQTPTSAEAP